MPIQQTESKNEQIKDLFKKEFAGGEWGENGEKVEVKFNCQNKDKCKCYADDNNPKYSSLLGDENSDVMLIAEASRAEEKKGCYFWGESNKFFSKPTKGNIKDIFDFFKNNFNIVPYFTDLMKCGVPKQNDKKGLSKERIKNCVAKFLIKEIEIIDPKIIYCIGKTAYDEVKKLQSELEEKTGKSIEIIPMLHYSNQANLPITIKEKEIIWQIQTGILKGEAAEKAILNFEFIKKIIYGGTDYRA